MKLVNHLNTKVTVINQGLEGKCQQKWENEKKIHYNSVGGNALQVTRVT